jgi:hypothetical protein
LGEFGAPIPDLQGSMTEGQQADWIKSAMELLANNKNLIGINYWTSFGGSTELWNDDGSARQAESVVKSFFDPYTLEGVVINEAGQGIAGATINSTDGNVISNANGQFSLPYDTINVEANVSAEGYYPVGAVSSTNGKAITVILKKQSEDITFKFQKLLYYIFN